MLRQHGGRTFLGTHGHCAKFAAVMNQTQPPNINYQCKIFGAELTQFETLRKDMRCKLFALLCASLVIPQALCRSNCNSPETSKGLENAGRLEAPGQGSTHLQPEDHNLTTSGRWEAPTAFHRSHTHHTRAASTSFEQALSRPKPRAAFTHAAQHLSRRPAHA
eukprot:364699-Chlamydomonas_euryale.AAC.6